MGHWTLRFHGSSYKPVGAAELNWRALLPWGLAAAAVVAALSGWTRSAPQPPPPNVARFEVVSDDRLANAQTGTNLVLSPDGKTLLYRKRGGGHAVRDLASLEEHEITAWAATRAFHPT